MQPRRFGSTDLSVTPIGLGLAALGRPGYLNLGHAAGLPPDRSVASMQAHAHGVLDRAAELGIRYVDVARSYGRAEEFLGSWLATERGWTTPMTVGSKWGYTYTAGWQVEAEEHEVKDHSLVTFERQLAETRANLGEHLHLYQIHSATLETGVLEDAEVLDALTSLSFSGVAIGLSLSGPDQARTLERALELTAEGRAPFVSVQATWNLLEPSVGPTLQAAHDAGWGVIIKEAVANGRLTPNGEAVPVLQRLAEELGTTVDALAIAAALAQPFTSVVLSGATTRRQLEDNLAATELDLRSDDLGDLASLAEDPATYWSTRSALPWT